MTRNVHPVRRPGRGLIGIAIAVVLILGGNYLVMRRRLAAELTARKFVDDIGIIEPALLEKESEFLGAIMLESGVDVRVRLVRSTQGQPLPVFALTMMREQRIGAEVGGRGVLILVDDSTKEARIEIGPHLEGVLPDAFVAYLLRENLSLLFEEGRAEIGVRTTLRMIHDRIRVALLGGEYDPRALDYVRDLKRLASGGGASVSIQASDRLRRLLARPTDTAIASYFSAQPTVELAYQRELEYMGMGLWPKYVLLFTTSTMEALLDQPQTIWTLLALSRDGVGVRPPRAARRSRGRGPRPPGARSRVCGARARRHRELALRERPDGAPPRRTAQGRAVESRGLRIERGRVPRTSRVRQSVRRPQPFRSCPRRRGLLGRRAAVQVRRRQHRPHGPRRWAVRRDRDRTVPLFLPPGDRARLHGAVHEPGRRSADRRYGTGRPLRDGRQSAAGGSKAAPRCTARGRDLRRSSLGREL